jgi:secreted Zn-dependent insulinase-like peptidase
MMVLGAAIGCQPNSTEENLNALAPDQPVVSPIDDRQYRALKLENGLQVLLVSDPETQKAAAALDVYVGSGDNPEGRGGLAHFLEHMLFLGTEKYPDPAEYEQYITEHGGNRNAYTSFDHTNYFFDVNAEHFTEALDRFAQFFVSPKMDIEYVDREMNAVQAEYQMGLKSDGRRGLDVLQALMHPEHPYSQFSVGSLESLADRPDQPIRADLLAFYERYYVAGNMRLVVLGSDSLGTLESMVKASFSDVPAGEVVHDPVTVPIFPETLLPAIVNIEPTASNRSLEIIFPIGDYTEQYLSDPARYLGHLLGHEGPSSLLAQLKREGLAESLSAGASFRWRGGALFYIDVKLTESGIEQNERIVKMTHSALGKLRSEGVQNWVFDELKRLSDLNFRFQEKGDPIRYVSRLASSMHDFPVQDWLRGGTYLERFDAELIQRLLDSMTPDKTLMSLSYPGVATDQLSPNYQTPYALVPGAKVAQPLARDDGAVAHIGLPAPNEFIAENVAILSVSNTSEQPVSSSVQGVSVWFQHDDEFEVPKGALNVNFRSAIVGQSPEVDIALELYTALVSDQANDFAYAAQIAGLQSSVYRHSRGVSLRVNGYNDKQVALLERLISVMQAMDFSEDRFNNLRAERIRQIENKSAQRPASQIMGSLREALNHSSWSDEQQVEALSALTLAEVKQQAKMFWGSVAAEVLLYGNYTNADIPKVIKVLSPLVADAARELPLLAVTKLNQNKRQKLTQQLQHDDAVISWYIQGSDRSVEQQALFALTGQSLKSGFFQQLRTEQQLGYIASAFSWPQSKVPGLVMIIQSPSHSSLAVRDAIDTFLRAVPADIDEAAFNRHRDALVAEINEPFKNLWERAEFLWQSLGEGDYSFRSKRDLANAVSNISYADWLAFFDVQVLNTNRSLLVVAPGKFDTFPVEPAEYREASEVKSGNEAFVVEL